MKLVSDTSWRKSEPFGKGNTDDENTTIFAICKSDVPVTVDPKGGISGLSAF